MNRTPPCPISVRMIWVEPSPSGSRVFHTVNSIEFLDRSNQLEVLNCTFLEKRRNSTWGQQLQLLPESFQPALPRGPLYAFQTYLARSTYIRQFRAINQSVSEHTYMSYWFRFPGGILTDSTALYKKYYPICAARQLKRK